MDYEIMREKIKSDWDLCYIDEIRMSDEETFNKARELFNNGENLNKIADFCKKESNRKLAIALKKEACLSKRFQTRTFENFIIENPTQKTALEKARQYTNNIDEYLESGTGLLIAGMGCVGTGKTHLACAAANNLLDRGYPVKVINSTRMIATIKEDFNIKPYIHVPILLIDDLGKEIGTAWVAETLYTILNERYEAMKPTIITTENGLEDLRDNYKIILNGKEVNRGNAIFSRLIEDFIYIQLTGEDFRQRRAA